MNQEPEGVSTRSLLGAFFAVVVLCAVFFSLGFFLGNRQAHASNTPTTEQVPATESEVPPSVNSPATTEPTTGSEPDSAASSGGSSATPAFPSPDSGGTQPRATASPAPVQVASDAKPSSEAPASASLDSLTVARVPAGVLVQVAALTNEQDAANVAAVLKSKRHPVLILTPAQAKAHDSFYRVVAGPYKTRSEAERARTELTAEGFKPFIR